MAAKPCDQWDHMCEPFVTHGQAVIHVKFCLDLFSHFREEDFWRFLFLKQYGCRIMWPMTPWIIFSVDHFIPRWPSKSFILIGSGVLHMQLWHHNEGTYDIKKPKPLIRHEEYLLCAKFQFFPWCSFRDTEVKIFLFFQHGCHTTRPMTS